MLAVSGQLDERMFGPGTLDEAQRRRSIYFTVKRSQLVPSMMLFDAPDALQGLGQRAVDHRGAAGPGDAQQPAGAGYARGVCQAACSPARASTDEQAIRGGYLTALARPADSDELADALAFVAAGRRVVPGGRQEPTPRELALADFCQVLLGLNEFVYVD